ncbi:hypothetical protein [Paracoccus sanguinis]|uniref:hypothetical protein n=1 Tax=Paracoccus sanguinis TaxID=1545044 RepID=UPI001B8C08F7|nr:hypothetical protein [Paracoccus sanguinis]
MAVADPDQELRSGGVERDWRTIAEQAMSRLAALLSQGTATFESEAAVLLHEFFEDHEALRDPEFWMWLATGPGRSIILARYPAVSIEPSVDEKDGGVERPRKPLPSPQNFYGLAARETLFFRLWIRAEMGRSNGEDPWKFVRPGMVDFWRSHVFRQLYAHHRPFLHALVDFQFPKELDDNRNIGRLNTTKIRILARELSMACANIVIESLDRAQCAALIQRVFDERVPQD